MKTFFSSVRIFSSGLPNLLKKYRPLTVFFLFTQPLAGKTLLVPQEYPSIQAAVDAAQVGDTVLVSPGVYYENVQLRGRDLVLTSRFALERNAALIEQTIIDGSRPAHPDTASCLLIWKGESAATVVQGFTLRGGTGTVWLDPAGYGTFREGGGILTEYSSPVIRHNVVCQNTVGPPGEKMVSNGGGGIRCGEGAPLIEHNRIVHNAGDGYGGGIVLNYCPGAVVRHNIIAFNRGGQDFSGGGFWCTGKDQTSQVLLRNNVIAFNDSPPARMKYGGKAGGVWTFSIHLQMENNIIWGNTQALDQQIGQLGALVEAAYNCTEEPFPGIGNLVADPLFADTLTFVLSMGSPCIDAGQPDSAAFDCSRNGHTAAYPARGGLRNDQGVYGGTRDALFPEAYSPFTKVTAGPVVSIPGDSRSVNWIDYDADGNADLFISNGPKAGENNRLYHNERGGRFILVEHDPTVEDRKPSDGATWGDFDNDGYPDCFVVNWYNVNNLMYRNNGNGTFTQLQSGAPVSDGGYSETAAWGDFDNDGQLDLYVANSAGAKHNFLYRNTGEGRFEKVVTGAPVTDAFTSRGVNWIDIDNDGDLDLFVTNEEGENENLYRNDGRGRFTALSTGPLLTNGGNTMSACWGDYDNDGDPDVFLANSEGSNALFRNDGRGGFAKVTETTLAASAGNSFGCQWADIDNDGDLDLFVTNAFGKKAWRNRLFLNNGDGKFNRDTASAPALDTGWSYGCAFGDPDGDGDLDLAVANCYNAWQTNALYENHASETTNHWLELNCIGTQSNRSAIGTTLLIRTHLYGHRVDMMRDISAQSGYCGQNQLTAHFGLGDARSVESLEVRWPSGLTEWYDSLPANQIVTVTEGQGMLAGAGSSLTRPVGALAIENTPAGGLRIRFLRQRTQPVKAHIRVVDALGKPVWDAGMQIKQEAPQTVEWNGRLKNGKPAPDGIYQAILTIDKRTFSRAFQKATPGE